MHLCDREHLWYTARKGGAEMEKRRRERKPKAEWVKTIKELCVSPTRQPEWARRHNVSQYSINRWKDALKKEGVLDDLLAPVELSLAAGTQPYALLLEGRPDIRLVLSPVSSNMGIRSLRLKAWSCGAECGDGNLYVFADAHVGRIRIFRWGQEQCVDISIEVPESSLKWPRLVEGKAILRRNELIKLVRLVLPYATQP